MDKLVFATGNRKKGVEIEEKLKGTNIPVEIIVMDFDEPDVNDVEVVSRSKVLQAYEKLQRPCFVIDSGFNIYSYPNNPGYPGAYVRRSGISENVDKLLDTMKDVEDRECVFIDCLTFYDGEDIQVFFGRDEGVLSHTKRGNENRMMRSPLWFVFKPLGYKKTLAEMTDEERTTRKGNHVSAKEQFIEWYKNEYKKNKQLIKK